MSINSLKCIHPMDCRELKFLISHWDFKSSNRTCIGNLCIFTLFQCGEESETRTHRKRGREKPLGTFAIDITIEAKFNCASFDSDLNVSAYEVPIIRLQPTDVISEKWIGMDGKPEREGENELVSLTLIKVFEMSIITSAFVSHAFNSFFSFRISVWIIEFCVRLFCVYLLHVS